jgi:hypothetical protein
MEYVGVAGFCCTVVFCIFLSEAEKEVVTCKEKKDAWSHFKAGTRNYTNGRREQGATVTIYSKATASAEGISWFL